MTRPGSSSSQEPLEIYAEFLARQEQGEPITFDELCRAHPEAANQLLELREACDHVASVFGDLPDASQSLAGGSVSDQAMLGGPGPVDELMERMEHRRPDSSRYQVLEELGRGGMGVVHRVFDRDLRRHLAMKVVSPERTRSRRSSVARRQALGRFLGEAQLAAQLNHPGIVSIHDVGVDDAGQLFFTMPQVEGATLHEVLDWARRGRDGWNRTRVLGVLVSICEAVAYAHARGVVHRDLKPSNIMIGKFGETYVMDWGLARLVERRSRGTNEDEAADSGAKGVDPSPVSEERIDSEAITTEREQAIRDSHREDGPPSPFLTREGAVLGTPVYMAPEQAAGQSSGVGTPSDVYSVGAMLYETLAGQPPYASGPAGDHGRVLAAVRAGPPKRLEDRQPGLAPELVAICEKAMARDPQARYADLQSMAEDLRAFLDQRVVQAYRTGAWVELKKWVSRNRAMASVLLASLVVLAGTVLIVSFLNRRLQDAQSDLLATNADLLAKEKVVQRQFEEVTQLSDLTVFEQLRLEADQLWPARPHLAEAMADWIDRAEELVARRDRHESSLAGLRERAVGGPPHSELGLAEGWKFASPEEQWWHDNLHRLTEELHQLDGSGNGLLLQMRQRLHVAETIEEETIGQHALAWEQAIRAIEESPRYHGLVLEEQIGLVPLGPDPRSGLWEFWHVESGERPPRDLDTGGIRLEENSGIVLVLVPGGSTWIGAQAENPADPNYDPFVQAHEGPPQEVTLAPFFLSKFEGTQQQSIHLCGENPSDYAAGAMANGVLVTGLHPCTNATWQNTLAVLQRFELTLPSEAQWEHAARAGTTTPWWCGERAEAIGHQRAGNLADVRFDRHHGHNRVYEPFDDGHAIHAPVGSYEPNGFGFHDMIGNAAEWCLDWFAYYDEPYEWAPGSGERLIPGATVADSDKMIRGGGFLDGAHAARSAHRYQLPPDERGRGLGSRPARPVMDAVREGDSGN